MYFWQSEMEEGQHILAASWSINVADDSSVTLQPVFPLEISLF